ncbi:hypothetical protein BK011_06345 [Tenericutes bacterium MZ-XQ]|jgi:hypothetical protein|nr:hypothetical protein BK011_06345 [Tenericutes bacterium MZ-XQ]
MTHFEVPWSFYFQVHQDTKMVKLHLSEYFQNKEGLSNRYYVLSYDDVTNYLHKYDHRKLNYFFERNMKETFDMLIRIKNFNKKKGYIKTHALCYIKDDVMHCLSIDYLDVINAKKKLDQLVLDHEVHIDINYQIPMMYHTDIKLEALKEHLFHLMHREYTI